MHDPAVIQQALAGDRAAFETLVAEHQRAIYGYLRGRVLVAQDAEDLTQEVFLRFYQARAKFDTSQLVRPWLFGIARNLLHEHIRDAKQRKQVAWTELCLELETLIVGHDRDESLAHEDAMAHLPVCLSDLGPSAREAIELRYRRSWRMAAVAEKLKRSEGAVKLLVHRARLALKHCLNGKLALMRNRSDA